MDAGEQWKERIVAWLARGALSSECRNAATLTAAVRRILEDPDLAEQLSRSSVSQFEWEMERLCQDCDENE